MQMNGIHLHRKLFNPWLVLHELAHWIDPREGHSHRWAYINVELVIAAIGEGEGQTLRAGFEAHDLPCHW
jgi:hypothetical protein